MVENNNQKAVALEDIKVVTDDIYAKLKNVADKKALQSTIKKVDNTQEYVKEQLNSKADADSVYLKYDADQKFATFEALEQKFEEVSTVKGDKGDPGETGPQGPQGEQGIQGPQGEAGKDGKDGVSGKSAYEIAVANGFEGSESAWLESLKGEQGQEGAQGEAGAAGADGKSAYELAVTNGFEGTEAEWLESLKGEAGAKGEKGDPGEIPNIENFVQKEDLTEYAKAADIPDLTNYAKTEDIPAQKTLAELGGVTQQGVEVIIQSKNFLSEDAIKKLIADAIAEAMKSSDSGDTPTPEPDPTPLPQFDDSDYQWTHYFVIPAGTTDISDHVITEKFFGEDTTVEDYFGENYDMKNTTIEIRVLGTLRDNKNEKCAVDDQINGRTYAIDFTKIYKDGLRVPFDASDGMDDKIKEYKDTLQAITPNNNTDINFDGEDIMFFNRFTAGCGLLYMVRKLKDGKVFPEYSIGEKIA